MSLWTREPTEGRTPKRLEPPNAPGRDEALAVVRSFPWWYHRIYLGDGVYTIDAPTYHESVWGRIGTAFPPHLGGASVLDVGSNAGYFSIQLALRGAGRVVGIEPNETFRQQATACARIWGLDLECLGVDAHELGDIREQFDIVMFAGILYHLQSPLQVLMEVGRICRDAIVVESEVIPDDPGNGVRVRQGRAGETRLTRCSTGIMKFIESTELNDDGTNWWVPDTDCLRGMLRTAGFRHFSAPVYASDGRVEMIASKNPSSILDLRAFG